MASLLRMKLHAFTYLLSNIALYFFLKYISGTGGANQNCLQMDRYKKV